MKKSVLFSLVAFICLSVLSSGVWAQLVPLAKDTTVVVNGASVYSYSPSITKNASSVTLYFKLTKNSGTVAGTTTLEGSIDGTNYYAVPGVSALTHANQTINQVFFVVAGSPFVKYRLNTTGAGTMNATISEAKVFVRR